MRRTSGGAAKYRQPRLRRKPPRKSALNLFVREETAPGALGQLYNLKSNPGQTTDPYFEDPENVQALMELLDARKAMVRTAVRSITANASPPPNPDPFYLTGIEQSAPILVGAPNALDPKMRELPFVR